MLLANFHSVSASSCNTKAFNLTGIDSNWSSKNTKSPLPIKKLLKMFQNPIKYYNTKWNTCKKNWLTFLKIKSLVIDRQLWSKNYTDWYQNIYWIQNIISFLHSWSYRLRYLYFLEGSRHHGNQHVQQHDHRGYVVRTKDPVPYVLCEIVIEIAEFHSGGLTQRKQRPEHRVKRGWTVKRYSFIMTEFHYFLSKCMWVNVLFFVLVQILFFLNKMKFLYLSWFDFE